MQYAHDGTVPAEAPRPADNWIKLRLTPEGDLQVSFPERNSRIRVPNTTAGLSCIVQLLQKRGTRRRAKFAEDTSPTQEMMNEVVRAWGGEITKIENARKAERKRYDGLLSQDELNKLVL